MKKKFRSTNVNTHLRIEREHQGWTQADLAEKLGLADTKTVGRWERGISYPSACFRQKLCEIFGKTPEDLGLIRLVKADESILQVGEQNGFSASSPSFLYDPTVPPALTGRAYLIGRNKLLRDLKRSLCSKNPSMKVALHGLPGIGKTTVAVALAHDREIQAHFRDGVLWARVGSKSNVAGLLRRWGMLLGMSADQMEGLMTSEAWAEALRVLIHTRQILFVIDDAWRIEDVLALTVGGPNCSYLITTRFPDVALRFDPEECILVPELNRDDGMALLACFIPNLVSSELHTVCELVQLVGGLPLALTLMGKYLHRQAHSGQPRRLKSALQRLYDVEERLQLAEPRALLGSDAYLLEETQCSLQAVIEASICHLDENVRSALYALAIFPAKPNSFTEEAALEACALPVEMLDALTDTGLLESSSPGRYTMHQVIVDYARTKQRSNCAG